MFELLSKYDSEGDVETQFVLPFLTRGHCLQVPLEFIRSKEYISARDIGKGKKQQKGYIPDFLIRIKSLPIFAIEAKSPQYGALQAYDEARLYATEINSKFPTNLNPCKFILGTNGMDLHIGFWDSEPKFSLKINELQIGENTFDEILDDFSKNALESHAIDIAKKIKVTNFKRPFNRGGGNAMIASKMEPNTFAADIAPVLMKYFSSKEQNKDREIHKLAYVSSNEVTTYDRVLDSFLKDRVARLKSRTLIETKKSDAPKLTKRIQSYKDDRPVGGDLQLITGGVGAGKSLFARRYREILQPEQVAENTHWAFINFNNSPPDLGSAEEWLYKSFCESLIEEGAPLDISDGDDQERVFADKLRERAPFYKRMNTAKPNEGDLERARDIEQWRQEPKVLAAGISRYLQGDRGENIVVVFDNVDRRNGEEQLVAFQYAMNFKSETRALVILQMRDSTFELYKNQPPLDTYRTGTVFHISAPRFVDVVKKRLLLSLNALSESTPDTLSFTTPSGVTISYPKTNSGAYLTKIYTSIFDKPTNIAKIIEALSGKNVRRALDMFISIISSGHMPEDLIAKVAVGNHLYKFPEYALIKILMRGESRFFSDNSGFISNIFYSSNQWVRPSNFLVIELLFFLIGKRKVQGDNGHIGYISIPNMTNHLENMGFISSDVFEAIKFSLEKNLIESDNFSTEDVNEANCIKATASGWAHMRILSIRPEYILGLLPTTPISSQELSDDIFDALQLENSHGKVSFERKKALVDKFASYLEIQYAQLSASPGFQDSDKNGSLYIIKHVRAALQSMKNANIQTRQLDWLDT